MGGRKLIHGLTAAVEGDVPLLEIEQVSVAREEIIILDNISIKFPPGRHTAVLGPNGAGKTSLLKLLLKQFYPSVRSGGEQGIVRILGRSDWELFELKRHMGIVSSTLDLSFSSGRTGRMSVLQAVASGFTGTELAEFGLPITSDLRAQVDEILLRVGIRNLLDRRVETLSTGERRRTLIARALVHNPSILVLDEPTTGLDIVARHNLLETLQTLVSERDLTLLLVTHHVEEIIPEIQHVVLLGSGRIVFDGCKEKALTDQRLSTLYGASIRLTQNHDGTFVAMVG